MRAIYTCVVPTSFISLRPVCTFILPFCGNITIKTVVKTQIFGETRKKTRKKKKGNVTTILFCTIANLSILCIFMERVVLLKYIKIKPDVDLARIIILDRLT